MEGVKNIQRASFLFYFAKLSPAQSNSNSVGWAEIALIAQLSPAQSNSNSVGWVELALIPTFTHPPPTPRKILRRLFQYGYWPNFKCRFVGPSYCDDQCPSGQLASHQLVSQNSIDSYNMVILAISQPFQVEL